MVNIIKKDRNAIIINLRDEKKLSWRKISELMKIAHSTAHEVYTEEKKRSGLTKNKKGVWVKLSPVKK
jgi:hypothetical protein